MSPSVKSQIDICFRADRTLYYKLTVIEMIGSIYGLKGNHLKDMSKVLQLVELEDNKNILKLILIKEIRPSYIPKSYIPR